MLSIKLVGDQQLIARLNAMPGRLRDELRRKVTELTLKLEAKVKAKLSGQVLNVVTGALRRSIFSTVTATDVSVVGKVASSGDVKYAATHEFGAKIHIPEIVPTKAAALHFVMGGKEVFAKRVRAHDVRIPERSFLRSSLAEMKSEIVSGMSEAVKEGLRK